MEAHIPTFRSLRLVPRVSRGRGPRAWFLVLSVFLVDVKYAFYAALERPLVWALHQYPAEQAARIAARLRVQDLR